MWPLWSPKVHLPEEVGPALLRRLRKQHGTDTDCDAAGASAAAAAMFRRRGAPTTLDGTPLPDASGGEQQQQQPTMQLGGASCFLFARKFPPESVPVRRERGQAMDGTLPAAAAALHEPLTCPALTPSLQPLLALAADCAEGTGLAPSCLPGAGAEPQR